MQKKIAIGARLFMGLIFFVFGLNGFLQFIPMPTEMPEAAQAMMGGLAASGYFFPLLKVTEILCGLLLLTNFFVPLAVAVLAPITINIFFYHTVVDPAGMPMAILLIVLNIFLSHAYRDSYLSMLKAKTEI